MATVVRVHRHGGPEVLEVEEAAAPAPAAGEILVRQRAVGLNFIDVYHRSGLYPLPLPAVLGREAAGVVEALGEGVDAFRIGDHVAYPLSAGAYADLRTIPAARAVRLPEGIDEVTAAAMMLKGTTVEYLLERCFPVRAGQTILFHAAAGGVGLIACQWARALGVEVIGTVSTEEKAALAADHGCAHPVIAGREDIAARVREITGGAGVPVAYDSVGAATFEASLASLAPRGMLVSFGQSSGPVASFDPVRLARGGSLFYTRPGLVDYIATGAELRASAGRLFEMVTGGKVAIRVNHRWPLAEIREAHRALEGRRTTGSSVLLP